MCASALSIDDVVVDEQLRAAADALLLCSCEAVFFLGHG
jgi:hypothetical protein